MRVLTRSESDAARFHHERRPCVVLVISNLEYGGAQRQVVEIANRLPQRGFDVRVCTLSTYVPLASHLRCPSDQLHTIRKRWKFDISTVPRLAAYLRHVQADVVHGFLFDANIVARLAGFLARTPLVIDSERNSDYRLKLSHHLAYGATRHLRDLCVANSHAGARFNSRVTGMPLDRYRVVYNGVDVERFHPADQPHARRSLGLADDAYVVGMFASFKPRKNHPIALRAFARLVSRIPRSRLLLVGDELAGGLHGTTGYKRALMDLIGELGIKRQCLLLGNRTDIEAIYPACDLVILPSRFEGTPNVALEAMACGLPVVASDVADNVHVIPSGKAGRVIALDDVENLAAVLAELAASPQDTARMGAFARQWVSDEFSCDSMIDRIADVYRTALRDRSRAL